MSQGAERAADALRVEEARGASPVLAGILPIAIAIFAFWASWRSVGLPGSGKATFLLFGVLPVPLDFRELTSAGTFLTLSGVMLALLGVAVFLRRREIDNPRDYYGGLALIGLAVVALWASNDLQGMSGFKFGPGTAPRLFAVLLAVLGAVVMAIGLAFEGAALERYAWRGPLFITASVLVFAAAVRPLGLVATSFITIMVCAAAAEEVRWRETTVVAIALTIFCSLLFPYALSLPMPLWPEFWR
jgi:putative tricarboxylic transport membrane protein